MKRSASPRPSFPFLGAALLLAAAATLSAVSFDAYLTAVVLAALGLISLHLGTPAPEPVRAHARSARAPRHDC
jgi:hypothetical protein